MTHFIHILLSLTTYSRNLSNISFVWNLMVTVKEWKSECGVSSVCVECVSSHRRWQQGVTLCWSSLSLSLVFSLSQVVSCGLRFLVSLLMTVCHIVMDVSTLHKVSFANRSHSPESSFFLQTYGEFHGFFFFINVFIHNFLHSFQGWKTWCHIWSYWSSTCWSSSADLWKFRKLLRVMNCFYIWTRTICFYTNCSRNSRNCDVNYFNNKYKISVDKSFALNWHCDLWQVKFSQLHSFLIVRSCDLLQ